MVCREAGRQGKGSRGPDFFVRRWVRGVAILLCRLTDPASLPVAVACVLFLKSASCYPRSLLNCLLHQVAPLLGSCVLRHFLMSWCFLLRYYPKRWITHGKRALWPARKGLWAVWRVLFLQEGLGSHCGRWSDPEVLLRGAGVMESPHKDQHEFPVHQCAAHRGVGAGRPSALLCPAAAQVRLPPSSWRCHWFSFLFRSRMWWPQESIRALISPLPTCKTPPAGTPQEHAKYLFFHIFSPNEGVYSEANICPSASMLFFRS